MLYINSRSLQNKLNRKIISSLKIFRKTLEDFIIAKIDVTILLGDVYVSN